VKVPDTGDRGAKKGLEEGFKNTSLVIVGRKGGSLPVQDGDNIFAATTGR
jgi:hypothetical protein